MTTGAYAGQSHDAIVATLGLLKHYQAFLASSCTEMRDPNEIAQWRDGATRLDKAAARQRLTWLIHVAINRKAGVLDHPLNHRGTPTRKHDADYERGQRQDRNEINHPRLIIRQLRTPELARRFAERIREGRELL